MLRAVLLTKSWSFISWDQCLQPFLLLEKGFVVLDVHNRFSAMIPVTTFQVRLRHAICL